MDRNNKPGCAHDHNRFAGGLNGGACSHTSPTAYHYSSCTCPTAYLLYVCAHSLTYRFSALVRQSRQQQPYRSCHSCSRSPRTLQQQQQVQEQRQGHVQKQQTMQELLLLPLQVLLVWAH
jgi:hypothetical protein